MPVANIPVRTFQQVLLCDKCGAEMEYWNAHLWKDDKPKFLHGCPECGHQTYVEKVYPEIVYERISGDTE